MNKLNKKQIIDLLPHREPMLLIDELYDIKKLFSATAVVNVKKDSFFVQGHFPGQPVMPGVLIVESFGQAAAALTAHGIDKSTYENKLVFLMGVEKARFRNPVIPDCQLILKIEAIRSHGRVWKYKGEAFVDDKITNAKLKVQFFWPFKGDYWIIDLDKNYQYAIISEPDRQYLWILSRSPNMDTQTLETLKEKIRSKGFDLTYLKQTLQ